VLAEVKKAAPKGGARVREVGGSCQAGPAPVGRGLRSRGLLAVGA
jgi:hypothetical protein